jgi:hypothetical protein
MSTRNHRLRRGLALATVVGALAAPAASAAPVGADPPYTARYTPMPNWSQPAPVASDGFDWADAGIGAAGMLAVVALAAGTTVAVGHRTDHGHRVA